MMRTEYCVVVDDAGWAGEALRCGPSADPEAERVSGIRCQLVITTPSGLLIYAPGRHW